MYEFKIPTIKERFATGVMRKLDQVKIKQLSSKYSQGKMSMKTRQMKIGKVSLDIPSMPSDSYGVTGLNKILESDIQKFCADNKVDLDVAYSLIEMMTQDQHRRRIMRTSSTFNAGERELIGKKSNLMAKSEKLSQIIKELGHIDHQINRLIQQL